MKQLRNPRPRAFTEFPRKELVIVATLEFPAATLFFPVYSVFFPEKSSENRNYPHLVKMSDKTS